MVFQSNHELVRTQDWKGKVHWADCILETPEGELFESVEIDARAYEQWLKPLEPATPFAAETPATVSTPPRASPLAPEAVDASSPANLADQLTATQTTNRNPGWWPTPGEKLKNWVDRTPVLEEASRRKQDNPKHQSLQSALFEMA